MFGNMMFKVGDRIRSLIEFTSVPKGTEGIIDEDYGTGFMVAWDLPDSPLPKGYCKFEGGPAIVSGILRDGFDKVYELDMIGLVQEEKPISRSDILDLD